MRITRTEYLNKLIAFKDKQLIKAVTGIRRCGKSVLMEMYQDCAAAEWRRTRPNYCHQF